MVGHRPGMGDYEGRMSVSRSAADEYAITLELRYADGTNASGKGSAIVYSGYEWRGSLDLGNEKISQVLALSEDGQELSGRWFLTDSDVLGADVHAVRDGGSPRILAVEPPFLKSGEQTEVAIHGVGLDGDVSLGDGVEIERRAATPDTVRVLARAKQGAAVGARAVTVGKAEAQGLVRGLRQGRLGADRAAVRDRARRRRGRYDGRRYRRSSTRSPISMAPTASRARATTFVSAR